MKTDRRILDEVPGAAVRLIALAQLKLVVAAGPRLAEGMPDAPRDFRDAVRRLRTTLVVYREELRGSVRRRERRTLREFVRQFNPQRNVEAQQALLRALPRSDGQSLVEARLANQIETARSEARLDLKNFRKATRRLRDRLEIFSQRLDPDDLPVRAAFSTVAASAACRLATDTMTALTMIRDVADVDSMRSALTTVKKLRYIIEPLRTINMTAVDASARLVRLQYLLRTQRDYARLLDTIQSLSDEAGEPERLGLQEVAAAARTQAGESYTELHRLWLDDNHKWFFQRIIAALTIISEPAAVQQAPRRGFRAAENPWRDPSSVSAPSF